MFKHFEPRHIPALFTATVMTFGGLWTFFDPHGSMLEFGLPERIARTPQAAALPACDTILAILGAYAGLVDSWVVWREGNPRKAAFRLVSSGLLSAAGFAGLTSGGSSR
ncbi:efflux pump antibiotic resistance protein [Apiospora sp. TS-2023a]